MTKSPLSIFEMHLIADKGYSILDAKMEAKRQWDDCKEFIESKRNKTTKSDFSTWENEDITQWQVGLVTESYIFYTNYNECDYNGNTKMYDRKMNLISDNYFAFEALKEEMKNIYEKQTIVYYMSPEIAKEIYLTKDF